MTERESRSKRRTRPGECGWAAGVLPGLPDGDLKPETAARLGAHLEACAACREEARALRGLSDLLRAAPGPEPALPSGAEAAAWILERSARRGRPFWGSPVFLPSASLALAAGLALLVLPPHRGAGRIDAPRIEVRQPESLPALFVMDDEDAGRTVILAPEEGYGPDAKGSN